MRSTPSLAVFLVIGLAGLLNFACPRHKPAEPEMHPIGPAVTADLLIYFKAGATHDEINAFSKTVLSRPHPEGRGDYLPPGVRISLRLRSVQGHEGIAITFFPNATKEQRRDLRASIDASALVYRVLENRAPDSVDTIEP